MQLFDRESFSFSNLPDYFGLKITHEEKINVTYMKEIKKKLLSTHIIVERVTLGVDQNTLYPVDIFYFRKKLQRNKIYT